MGIPAPQIALISQTFAQVSSSGLIVVAPIATQIPRMERRTASRKAALAFSIRCHRSAIWMASGNALSAASPYPPPRSRETILIVGRSESQACTVAFSRSGQQRHDPPSLQIADDCPVAAVPAEGPVIDAGTTKGSRGIMVRRRTTRRKVSLLTGIMSRLAKLAAGLPPSAKPR